MGKAHMTEVELGSEHAYIQTEMQGVNQIAGGWAKLKRYECLYQMTLCWTVPWGVFLEAEVMVVTPSSCISEPVLESIFRTAWSLQPDMADRQPWVLNCKEPVGNRALESERELRYSPLPLTVVYKTVFASIGQCAA